MTYTEEYKAPLPFCPLALPMDDHTPDLTSANLHFSAAAMKILMNYKSAFPGLFERIREFDTPSDIDDLFDRETDLARVLHFVDDMPYHDAVMMNINSVCCSPAQANLLQQTTESLNKQDASCDVRVTCSPDLVAFWERTPVDESITDAMKVTPEVGCRVVVIGGNDVPFGSTGYVLAIHPYCHIVEVVMDKPFIGGTDLYGLLKVRGRGA